MQRTGEIKISRKMAEVFDGPARYRCAHGGRGSGKTRTYAQMAALWGYRAGMRGEGGKILLLREYHNSIDASSFEEIRTAIRGVDFLEEYYSLGRKYVHSKDGRIEFEILGLSRSLNAVKSRARVILAWVDEAEPVRERGWRILLPSVREAGSELWVTWNPESPDSPVDNRFRKNPPKGCKIVEVNWRDNPWFPEVLEAERQNDLKNYPEMYNHIWEGAYLEYTDGAYYAGDIKKLQDKGRISQVDYDQNTPVTTAWDIGFKDETAIWFAQKVGQEIRIIDYYENSMKTTAHYVSELQKRDYVYGKHILPSDAKRPQINTGDNMIDALHNLGLKSVEQAPGGLTKAEGRDAVRRMLPHCWFDAARCKHGLRALKSYQRRYNESTQYWGKEVHDWASHGADAFRYLALGGAASSRWDEDMDINSYLVDSIP